MHIIAAKAVAFGEALKPEFKTYVHHVVENTKAMGRVLIDEGFALVSGGTDSHVLLVDLRPVNVSGKDAATVLDHARMTCNKNSVPNDPTPPTITSGIRLGAAACTTRGFGVNEFETVGHLIAKIVKAESMGRADSVIESVRQDAKALLDTYPIYQKV